ncbi:hypothetical protein [Neolewinella antarctica]|uniref:Uncharacterized protein n=1 Tax=Neolewinella antarctica TaxID=442734 RepID=A0ABX0XFK7_9BACT|nr:hypothetical protein [Neolewinella antarctica]NJC28104.1 hypothetical protein [Neolewinella antarctica]
MNAQHLIDLIDRLTTGIDPTTNRPFDLESSIVRQPNVSEALAQFKGVVLGVSTNQEGIPDSVLTETHFELTQLGYRPTVEQIVKVLRGSRLIADPTLRAVSAYGAYRSKFSKRFIEQSVKAFAARQPTLFSGLVTVPAKRSAKRKKTPAHSEIPFFREQDFDKLSDEKGEELMAEVTTLGLAKPTDKLPEYMAKARVNYPRAYEPWSRAEQALLIEAMCYTNDAQKIGLLFGRTKNSITGMGQKLIYESQQKKAA